LIDHSCRGNPGSFWNVPGALERYTSPYRLGARASRPRTVQRTFPARLPWERGRPARRVCRRLARTQRCDQSWGPGCPALGRPTKARPHRSRVFWRLLDSHSPSGVSGSLQGQVFRKLLRFFFSFGHQDAQTPPSPLVGEGGGGMRGKSARECRKLCISAENSNPEMGEGAGSEGERASGCSRHLLPMRNSLPVESRAPSLRGEQRRLGTNIGGPRIVFWQV